MSHKISIRGDVKNGYYIAYNNILVESPWSVSFLFRLLLISKPIIPLVACTIPHELISNTPTTVKPVLSGHSKRPKIVFFRPISV